MAQIVNINGDLFPPDQAKISVFDHGFLFGDSVYETMRTFRKKIFLVDRHLQRLQNSASFMNLKLPLGPEEFLSELSRTVEASQNPECYLRLIVTRGAGKISLDTDLTSGPTYVVIANPFEPLPAHYYESGIKLVIVTVRRNNQATVNPQAKTGNLLNNLLGFNEARKQNAFEGIFCNLSGYVTEGSGSNIFMVKDGILITPALEAGLLPGITRGLTLELASKENIPVEVRNITPGELFEADECFITGTTKGILPAHCINNTSYKHVPGPVTRRLMDQYKMLAESH